jgi:hypothetical protein
MEKAMHCTVHFTVHCTILQFMEFQRITAKQTQVTLMLS